MVDTLESKTFKTASRMELLADDKETGIPLLMKHDLL